MSYARGPCPTKVRFSTLKSRALAAIFYFQDGGLRIDRITNLKIFFKDGGLRTYRLTNSKLKNFASLLCFAGAFAPKLKFDFGGFCPPILGGANLHPPPFFEFWARGKCTQIGYTRPLTTNTISPDVSLLSLHGFECPFHPKPEWYPVTSCGN